MSGTLKDRAYTGVFWSAASQLSLQASRFVVGVILARILAPEQFGVIAMTYVFLAIADALASSGFRDALIQKRESSILDESSVFYFSVGVSLALAAVLALSAPLVERFYGQPGLGDVLRWVCLSLVFRGASIVYVSLAVKRLAFKAQFKVQALASVLAGSAAIAMALSGFGVMSLVAQVLVTDFLSLLLYPVFVRWKPAFAFSPLALREMFGFGSKMFLSGLVGAVMSELYSVVVGKFYSAASLGFYSRARQLQQLPVMFISSVIGKVALPVFSQLNGSEERFSRGLRSSVGMACFLGFPLMAGLAAVAASLVPVLLGSKWSESIPLLRLFCLVGATYPLRYLAVGALAALGQSGDVLRVEVLGKSLVLVLLFIVVWGGGAIWSVVVVEFIASLIYLGAASRALWRRSGYSYGEQARDVLPSLGIAGLMGLCVAAMELLPLEGAWLLGTQCMAGAALYFGLAKLARLEGLREFQAAFEKLLGRRSRGASA